MTNEAIRRLASKVPFKEFAVKDPAVLALSGTTYWLMDIEGAKSVFSRRRLPQNRRSTFLAALWERVDRANELGRSE